MRNNYCNFFGKIFGRVQGVGYRAWFKKNAKKLKICGWVKNCKDNSVEFEIFEKREILEKFIKMCYKGPLFCKVDKIIITEKSTKKFTDLEILME